MQVNDGWLQLIRRDDSGEYVVQEWELREISANQHNYQLLHSESKFFLRLTPKGAEAVS
jgi:hypothetical protein